MGQNFDDYPESSKKLGGYKIMRNTVREEWESFEKSY